MSASYDTHPPHTHTHGETAVRDGPDPACTLASCSWLYGWAGHSTTLDLQTTTHREGSSSTSLMAGNLVGSRMSYTAMLNETPFPAPLALQRLGWEDFFLTRPTAPTLNTHRASHPSCQGQRSGDGQSSKEPGSWDVLFRLSALVWAEAHSSSSLTLALGLREKGWSGC